MAIIIKDESNTRTNPIYIKTNETFPNQLISSKVFDWDSKGCSAVVIDNEPHIFGAPEIYTDPISGNQRIEYKGHYKYSNDEWVRIGSVPGGYELRYGCVIVSNDEIHLLGASIPTFYVNKTYYKYSNGSWTKISNNDMPYNFKHGSAVILNNEVHILGGTESPKAHWKYSNDEWVEVSTLPFNFYDETAFIFNNEIHIVGFSSIWKYSNGEWIKVVDLPSLPNSYVRRSVFCITCDDEVHLFTTIKSSGSSEYFNKHYKYVYNSNYWKELPNISYPTSLTSSLSYETSSDIFSAFVISSDAGTKKINYMYLPVAIIYHINDEEYRRSTVSYYSSEVITYISQQYIWEQNNNLPYDFYDGSAVVINNEIHILGGAESLQTHRKYSNGQWVPVSTLPYDFYNGSAVILNNEIHILGSTDNPDEHYKYSNGEWGPVSTLPFDFYIGGAAVVLNNEIHVLGTGGNRTKSHFKYSNGEWTELNQLPFVFHRGSAVIYNNTIHVLGSLAASQESDRAKQHYKYIASTDSWEGDESLPYGFYSGSAVVLNDEIHILGGTWSLDSHYKFSNGVWTEVGELPYDFKRGSAVVLNDGIYLLGSSDNPENYYKYVKDDLFDHLYNKIKDIWTKVKMPTYDQYGNCTIVEQAKKVKAIWVGGPDNKAKRIFY